MAAGMLVPVVGFWKEWGILALVLLSFALQVILLVTAEIRRRKDSGVLKVVVWLAYMAADTTAIYVLGHMSVTGTTSSQERQQLTAFWAPFLLLHLGGQDNITAYSIEDNRLWLRHLQSFVIQVLAAAYVLYQSSIVARPTLLRQAAILMFVVGVVKYGERVCALKHACSDNNMSPKNYQYFNKVSVMYRKRRSGRGEGKLSQELGAHELLSWAKTVMKGPLSDETTYICSDINYEWDYLYGVAEIQLSLMHDVFYTKSELIHTLHGYCIRVFSLSGTAAALVLFCRFISENKDGYYRRKDVTATYVLLAGAVLLEITSVLMAMISSWAYGREVIDEDSKGVCYPALAWLSSMSRQLAVASTMRRGSARCWSGSMGQHNFIEMWNHCMDSRCSRIARWMGRQDWWNMLVYTSSVPVSPGLSELLKKQIKASKNVDKENPDHIHNSRGRAALKRKPGLYEALSWSLDNKLDKTILIWHMATHVYLTWYETEEHAGPPHHLAQITKELSNYMMFLLAARPYMLSDNASRLGYVQLSYDVNEYLNNYLPYRLRDGTIVRTDLVETMRTYGTGDDSRPTVSNMRFEWASRLGSQLISIELETPDAKMLELISQVWVELLCHAAHGCTPDSHARQLSNGGEFITFVALMLKYMEMQPFVGTYIFR